MQKITPLLAPVGCLRVSGCWMRVVGWDIPASVATGHGPACPRLWSPPVGMEGNVI